MEERVQYEINARPDGGWEICRPLSWLLSSFRTERIRKIENSQTPVLLESGPKVVLHIVPNVSLNGAVEVDVRQFPNRLPEMQPLASHGWNYRFNASGFLTEVSTRDGKFSGYLQLFRNGIFEAVSVDLFTARGNKTYLASLFFEDQVIEAASRFIKIAGTLDILAPYMVAISLLDVQGMLMGTDPSRHGFRESYPIDSDALLVSWIRIENTNTDMSQALRPSFDFIWQATGWPGSPYYGEDGGRKER